MKRQSVLSARACATWLAMVGLCVACGGPAAQNGPAASPSPAAPAGAPLPPPLPVSATPDVDITEPNAATVHGTRVAFDGIEEGLAWPALDKALGPRKPDQVLTLQVARTVPMIHLLRAAWTLRAGDVRVQSQDEAGVMHAIELRAKRDGASPRSGCHLAVFRQADGSLRIAAPGGPHTIAGDAPAASLARSLDAERAKCPIKYVAFGSQSDTAPWGPVFDVVFAVDKAKSAGDARYVLGQAMRAPAPAH